MKVTELDERVIQDIGHAFGYYDYGQEHGLIDAFPGQSHRETICTGDLGAALRNFGESLPPPPACFARPPVDQDLRTDGMQAECSVVEVTDLGMIGWIIVIVSGVVLVAATALRIRQVRRKQKEQE